MGNSQRYRVLRKAPKYLAAATGQSVKGLWINEPENNVRKSTKYFNEFSVQENHSHIFPKCIQLKQKATNMLNAQTTREEHSLLKKQNVNFNRSNRLFQIHRFGWIIQIFWTYKTSLNRSQIVSVSKQSMIFEKGLTANQIDTKANGVPVGVIAGFKRQLAIDINDKKWPDTSVPSHISHL